MCIRDRAKSRISTKSNKFSKYDAALESARQTSKTETINGCLLYTSDAADERSSVDLGGRRIIKKKKKNTIHMNYIEQKKLN